MKSMTSQVMPPSIPAAANAFGCSLRRHRAGRGWSQEHLALHSNVSPRHLSCLETGKAQPSREMVLRLAGALGLELRERNELLARAGFAAAFTANSLDEVGMAPLNRAIDLLLDHPAPCASVVVDRCWNVVRTNAAAQRLLATFVDPRRVPERVAKNLIRATVHPHALRPHIVNWSDVARVLQSRLEQAHAAHPEDEARFALLEEVRAALDPAETSPGPPTPPVVSSASSSPAAVLHLRRGAVDLRLFTILATVGSPLDVTAQDLTIESFFPADEATERWFRQTPAPAISPPVPPRDRGR
jgi:transcriptional regulator with XRE-family HTH domain